MKDLLKKYYEMDSKARNDLEVLYIYHVFLALLEGYDMAKEKLKKIKDIEKLIQIVQKCINFTDFSIDYIVKNIIVTINCQDVNIEDLENLTIEELIEVLFVNNNDESEKEDNKLKEDGKIIAEFNYNGYYCVFCKNKNKYLLILIKNEDIDVITFDKVEEIFYSSIDKKIMELKLYE